MKGNPEVVQTLNEALSEELTAINQYFLHAEIYENWGYERLQKTSRQFSIQEMKHAEELIERILFLEGAPDMSRYKKINVGRSIQEMLENDLNLEAYAIEMYNGMIARAAEAGDHGTAELLRKILRDEEHHIDEFETYLQQLKDMGQQIFLATRTEE